VAAARDGTAVDLQNEGLKDFSLTLIGVPREIPLGHVGLKSIMRVRRNNVHLKSLKNVNCPGILEQSMGARNRVGAELSYRPASLWPEPEFVNASGAQKSIPPASVYSQGDRFDK
jgi:hypothetical protein